MKNIIERIFAGAGIVAVLVLFMAAQTSVRNVTVGPNSVLNEPSLSVFYASNNPPLSSLPVISVAKGGTGATNAAGAQTNLSLVPGTHVAGIATANTFTANQTIYPGSGIGSMIVSGRNDQIGLVRIMADNGDDSNDIWDLNALTNGTFTLLSGTGSFFSFNSNGSMAIKPTAAACTLTLTASSAQYASIVMQADNAEDTNDTWTERVSDGGTLLFSNLVSIGPQFSMTAAGEFNIKNDSGNTSFSVGNERVLLAETVGSAWTVKLGDIDANNTATTFIVDCSNTVFQFLNGAVGINTILPGKVLEINSATGVCLRLTYNDADGSAANKVDLEVSSSGDLTITPSGGDVSVAGNLTATNLSGTNTGDPPMTVISTKAVGTAYTLTDTANSSLDFGTTDPVITVNVAGTYMVYANAVVAYVGATFAGSQTITFKVRRTNNTAADVSNTQVDIATQIITTLTVPGE